MTLCILFWHKIHTTSFSRWVTETPISFYESIILFKKRLWCRLLVIAHYESNLFLLLNKSLPSMSGNENFLRIEILQFTSKSQLFRMNRWFEHESRDCRHKFEMQKVKISMTPARTIKSEACNSRWIDFTYTYLKSKICKKKVAYNVVSACTLDDA